MKCRQLTGTARDTSNLAGEFVERSQIGMYEKQNELASLPAEEIRLFFLTKIFLFNPQNSVTDLTAFRSTKEELVGCDNLDLNTNFSLVATHQRTGFLCIFIIFFIIRNVGISYISRRMPTKHAESFLPRV